MTSSLRPSLSMAVVLAATTFGLAASAVPTLFTVDFDDLATGEEVTTQYADRGVVFSSADCTACEVTAWSGGGAVVVQSPNFPGPPEAVFTATFVGTSATTVSVDVSDDLTFAFPGVGVETFDSVGATINSCGDVWDSCPHVSATSPDGITKTLQFDGPIAGIRFTDAGSNGHTIDNLTYFIDVPTDPTDPTEKAQCKKGGWEAYGFRNQGQCIRFVNTGKDSR